MNPRFVTKSIHAYLDYPVAISLICMPFLLDLGTSHPFAKWLAVIVGVAAFLLTVLTDHHLGIIRVIPYTVHLLVDAAVGVTFLVVPFALGFSGQDTIYYLVNGIAVMIVVSLHKPEVVLAAE